MFLSCGCVLPMQQEDDIAKIAAKLSYITAINGNSIATATPLATVTAGGSTTGTATGIVAQQGVADFFSFTAAAGTATISGQVGELERCCLVLQQAYACRSGTNSCTLSCRWFALQSNICTRTRILQQDPFWLKSMSCTT
jgi:hypothetical protein